MNAKISLFVILLIGMLSSCLKPETFPLEPIIEFDSFRAMSDSGEISISFTDGDGDIGLREGDTTGSFSSNQTFHHNLFIEYYEKDDILGWIRGKDLAGNDITFLYRVPYLTPNGNNKALKGIIKVVIEPSYFNPLSSQSDTILYKIRLADRDLNVSNTIESPVITR
ncbi:MAG: hypothetical protein ABF264_03000 [Flavobacteriales bacterium]|jgi:hypothetical protein